MTEYKAGGVSGAGQGWCFPKLFHGKSYDKRCDDRSGAHDGGDNSHLICVVLVIFGVVAANTVGLHIDIVVLLQEEAETQEK